VDLDNWNSNITVATALIFYVLWSYNNGIWPLFFDAMDGSKVISGTRVNAVSASPATNTKTGNSSAGTSGPVPASTSTKSKSPTTPAGGVISNNDFPIIKIIQGLVGKL